MSIGSTAASSQPSRNVPAHQRPGPRDLPSTSAGKIRGAAPASNTRVLRRDRARSALRFYSRSLRRVRSRTAGCSGRRQRAAPVALRLWNSPRRPLRTERRFPLTFVFFLVQISWQRKDVERSAFGGVLGQIFHCVREAERGRRITRVKIGGDDRSGPTTDARQDRDVLLAVRSAECGRLADDAGTSLKLPKN